MLPALLGVAVVDVAVLVGGVIAVVALVFGAVLVRQAFSLTSLLRIALAERQVPVVRSGMPPVTPQETPPELNGMLAKLDSAQRLNARQFELQRSQFELFKRMRGDQDPRALAASILEFVGDHYEAPVGAFYLACPGERLELVASYGTDEDKLLAEIRMGQGVVGRAALRHHILVLNDLEPDHLMLATGLGASAPRAVVVAPFHNAGQVKGVLELGVAGLVEEEDLDFLKLSAESVAMALDSARSRARVHRLLEETRRQAEVHSQQQKELQATNEQLARSDRYKREFLANMSHELRTPLNSMLIMSQVLAENHGGRLARNEIEAAETINQAGCELLLIIDDILDMSMVESGKLELHPAPVSPRAIAASVEDLLRPAVEGQGLDLMVRIAAGTPDRVVTDQLRVNQILKNLLGNAVKFTEKGSVTLTVGPPDAATAAQLGGDPEGWLTFAVRDTGIGMDTETRDQVFEVFQQGDGSIGRRYGGSGLGLSISRSLAELLGGGIHVVSEAGVGSTFTLCLPLSGADSDPTDTAPPAVTDVPLPTAVTDVPLPTAVTDIPLPPAVTDVPLPTAGEHMVATDGDAESWRGSLAGRCVLLADNDMRAVYAISDLLDSMGALVIIARSAAECAEQVNTVPEIDVVLLNPALREMDGGPCCVDEARAQGRDLKGILLCRDPADIPADHDWTVLTKPVLPARLAEVCRSLVAAEPVNA